MKKFFSSLKNNKKKHELEVINLKHEYAIRMQELEERIDKLNKEIESHRKNVDELNKQLEEANKVCFRFVLKLKTSFKFEKKINELMKLTQFQRNE